MPTDLQPSTMPHFIIQVEPVMTIARPKRSASKIGQSRRSAAPAPTEWSGDGPRHRRIGMTVGAIMGFCWARASRWLVSEIAPEKDAATPGLCAMLTGLRNPCVAGPLPSLLRSPGPGGGAGMASAPRPGLSRRRRSCRRENTVPLIPSLRILSSQKKDERKAAQSKAQELKSSKLYLRVRECLGSSC